MDAERQPLLNPVAHELHRRFRPLTQDEVRAISQDQSWKRARFFLLLMFYAILAMFLSIVACILVTARCPPTYSDIVPSVPPVHLTFAPLLSTRNFGQTI